jgi:hypothetical protein
MIISEWIKIIIEQNTPTLGPGAGALAMAMAALLTAVTKEVTG